MVSDITVVLTCGCLSRLAGTRVRVNEAPVTFTCVYYAIRVVWLVNGCDTDTALGTNHEGILDLGS